MCVLEDGLSGAHRRRRGSFGSPRQHAPLERGRHLACLIKRAAVRVSHNSRSAAVKLREAELLARCARAESQRAAPRALGCDDCLAANAASGFSCSHSKAENDVREGWLLGTPVTAASVLRKRACIAIVRRSCALLYQTNIRFRLIA